MKHFCRVFPAILIFSGIIFTSVVYGSGNTEKNEKEEKEGKETKQPYVWPEHKITQQILHINPPVVVNFKERAEYELAHPVPKQIHFIEQGEDKDAEFKFSPLKVAPGTPVFNVPEPKKKHYKDQGQHLENSPAPTASFNGVLDNGTLIPPDIQGAAGPSYIMETTNQQFNIYTKSGQLNSQVQISNLFSATSGSGFFDPHILYDPNYGRFIICVDGFLNNNDGGLFIAVSQTSDPTGNWYTYTIDDGDNNQNDLLDYPEMGYNNNWVVLTANDFLSNGTIAQIYVLNRSDLYSGTLGTVSNFTDNNVFTWVPAQTFDANEATEYMVTDADGSTGAMQIGKITGTANAPVYNAGGNIAVNQLWNDNSVGASQAGTGQTIEDGDTRVMNGVVYLNGALWFTHNIFLPANTQNPTYSGVDWWQVNPAAMSVTQFGRLADPNAFKRKYKWRCFVRVLYFFG